MMPESRTSITPDRPATDRISEYLGDTARQILRTVPEADNLTAEECRGIIARYNAVLEGNFIYWMTGALIAVKSAESREIILDNLLEEVRDSHPEMLRRFTMAADACPDNSDVLVIHSKLSKVRLFIGKLSPAPILAMMAFYEDFIMRFMPILAEYAAKRGSAEREYTDVHSLCDAEHSQGLFRALGIEMALANDPREPEEYLFEGVDLLNALIKDIIGTPAKAV